VKDVIAQSPAMQPILQLIARVGPSDANVMILGENGTGKGVVAQALHAMSPRASRGMACSRRSRGSPFSKMLSALPTAPPQLLLAA